MTDQGATRKIYDLLLKSDPEAEAKMPPAAREHVPSNGLKLVGANALQSSGDQLVNASTVLPWIFATLGVPAGLTGMLVPIRESGSMLPQAFMTPIVLRGKQRKFVFVIGALVQAVSVAVMTATTALGSGLSAGIWIIAALAVFSLGRSLCSIASKDVQGRTIPKGSRGKINGLSTTMSGLVAITLGLALRLISGDSLGATELAVILGMAAVLWAAVAAIYITIKEPADESTKNQAQEADHWFTGMFRLLRDDRPFRNFVTVRSLLLVSSLSPPFVVTLSIAEGADSLAGLGGFIIASGLASLLGGRFFGGFADKSSKNLMSFGAAIASAILIATIIAALIPGLLAGGWGTNIFFIVIYFLLTMMHTGVRVGRKTYVVDMAEGDQRTEYVAVSNTFMGLMLLIVGGISSALAILGIYWALAFLALMGLIGVVAGWRLPDVSEGR